MLKKISPTLFFFIFTLIYFLPYFRGGLPVTHDGENHVARFAQYYLALKQGQFPPRLAPTLANGFGLPVFNYNYPLANILSLPLSVLKIDFEIQFKLLVIGGFCMAAWGFNLLLASWHFKHCQRLFPLLCFLLSPYLYTAIWYRGSIGEILQYYLLPWLLFAFERSFFSSTLSQQRRFTWLLVGCQVQFLLAHNVMVLIMAPFLFVYQIYRLWTKKRQEVKRYLYLWLLCSCLVAWFWLPALGEKSLINLDNDALSFSYAHHFLSAAQLFSFWPQQGLSFLGRVDGLSFGLGLPAILVLFLVIYLAGRHRQLLRFTILPLWFLIGSTLLLLWLQTSASAFLWSVLPFFNYVQFPWRLGLLVSFLITLLSSTLVIKKNTRSFFAVVIIIQALILCWSWPKNFFHHSRLDYLTYPQTTTTSGENFPRTFSYPYFQADTTKPVDFLLGTGEIKIISTNTTSKHYQLSCLTSECLLAEQTAYFPGFVTTINGQPTAYFNNEQVGGRLAYQVTTGNYQVISQFTQKTPIRLFANAISAAALLLVLYKSLSHLANFSRWTKRLK